MRFAGKGVIVTGAASGIGRATARAFAAEGARVTVADFDPVGGEETVAQIAAAGGTARFLPVDVASGAQVGEMVAQAVAWMGTLDVMHSNVGIDHYQPLVEMSDADIQRVLGVNLAGMIFCAKYALRAMEGRGGAIVLTSSVQGLIGLPHCAVYAATKAGIIGFTRTLSIEAGPRGVRVNAVCPGTIDTPMLAAAMKDLNLEGREQFLESVRGGNPLHRIGTPEEIAATVLFLASDQASYIHGTAVVADGGYVAWKKF
jgi:NAD(P)-dependent dehydrogenase (short-subunit alcohol dehydrogenase family)